MDHISKALRGVADKYNGVSLIIRIIVGLIAAVAFLALYFSSRYFYNF